EFDVAGLARSSNKGKACGETAGPGLFGKGLKPVEQVGHQLGSVGNGDVDGRQKAKRARLPGSGSLDDCPGFGDKRVHAGDTDVGGEKRIATRIGMDDLDSQ